MKVQINKAEDKFLAKVSNLEGDVIWSAESPMDRDTLSNALLEIGCHPIDISDEFERVSPTRDKSEMSDDVKYTYFNGLKDINDK